MSRRLEPLWWLLFAMGGTVAALVIPVQIALTGIAGPLGWAGEALRYEHVAALASSPLMRLYLAVTIALPLFHWAHRFRYGLTDGFQLGWADRMIGALCYGTAIVGTALTILVVFIL